MAEVITIIIGASTGVAIAAMYKLVANGSYIYGRRLMRLVEKKKLKLDLETSIKELNYVLFSETIYKIKVYDTNYNKEQLNKSKKLFRFGEEEIGSEEMFLKRFDYHYKRLDSIKPYIQNMIREEIERSIQLNENENRLDL